MGFMDKLRSLFKGSKGKRRDRAKHEGVSHQSVFRGKIGERAVIDEHELLKHINSPGSTGSDGLNRFV